MVGKVRIAVVGGGPAGATCARLMAAAGASTDLFEPRPESEKPCGGGIPGRALAELSHLIPGTLARRVVREVVIISPSNRRVRLHLPGGIHVFSRRELDASLRQGAAEAGAMVRHTRVAAVKRVGASGWEVRTEAGVMGPYDLLVGADGVRGIVRRALAPEVGMPPRFPAEDLTLALYGYVGGVAHEEIILKFFGGRNGYLWVFPRTDHVSIGICAGYRRVEPRRLEEDLLRFAAEQFPQGRLAASDLKGYFIPASSRPPAAGPEAGWALAGDAGGFVDPLTREGIAPAMRSAIELAEGLVERSTLMTSSLPENLRRAHGCVDGFYRESFLDRMIRLAARSSAIRAVLGDLLEGKQPYRGLKSRLLLNALPCGVELALHAATRLASAGAPVGPRS
ncbi:MAG TPA: NAD(P)/FAD-dependent oxidoreductase [Candidatus Polarisedimenticolia bacterium]|nr:NAD(P)/FAD-dependent oxidoreductase [Candidatus Polarisedimenticolia bacterium]